MGDPTSAHSIHSKTLRNKFELEKRRFSYADFHCEVVKNPPNIAESRSNRSQKQEDIVKHMSNLPSYLERGKTTQDKALNFGVIDWDRLENWQYRHLKLGPVRSNKCSPSSSNSSFFSTDGSSPQSSIGQSCSPASQKPHRVTLQSHFNVKETFPPYVKSCLGNVDRFQDFKDAPVYHCTKKKTVNWSDTQPRDCKMHDFYSSNLQEPETKSSLKGKMKIQDEAVNEPGNLPHPCYETHDYDSLERQKVSFDSGLRNNAQSSCRLQSKVINSKNLRMEPDSARNPNLNAGSNAANKQRSMSPIRRLSFSVSSKFAASMSTTKRAESPPVPRKSTRDHSCISNRAHSSPLKRLLEPLFSSKATNSSQYSETSHDDSKVKTNETVESQSTKQALFQTAIKNGRPLFTFDVENSSNILGATVMGSSSFVKDNIHSWIYTFFTVHKVKKKNGNWLSPSSKSKGHGCIPNVAAQMKVSGPYINSDVREFVLFSVDPSRADSQISTVHPHDELAAIVVKFSRKLDQEAVNQESFSMAVILPGGNHGVSSKGEPSPLIDRWLSGGLCDCGGWDLGCRLTTLTNQVQPSRRSNSTKVRMTTGQFELFFQGEVVNERPFFNLCPLKEGMFSVEYNSSLSILQAFSICLSVVECRNLARHTESRTYGAKRVQDDPGPVRFASFPPLSPVGRV